MQVMQGNNHIRAKLTNHAAILRTIYQYGPIKRSEIAARLELTLPTITGCVNAMIGAGIVRSSEDDTAAYHAPGRPAQVVDLIPDAKHFIGVEMRDRCRSLCVTDYRGAVLYRRRDDTFCDDYTQNMQATCALIRRAAEEGPFSLDDIDGIGIGMPGLVDLGSGLLRYHSRYSWRDKPIAADVAAMTGYKGSVTVENNVSARATGAQLFRRELLNGVPSFAYMFVATGIACPLILNVSEFRGSLIGAGEVGHMVVDPDGPRCRCGNRGCLEAFSSDQAVLAACREALGADAPDTMDGVLLAQERGVSAVQRAVDRALHMLGIAIANITNYSGPRIILIEGELFRSEANQETLLASIRQTLYSAALSDTEFIFVKADDYSGAIGGAAVAISNDLNCGVF